MENIQPFSAKDLSIRSLGDRIRDLGQLRNLYPNIPKDQAFGSHYNSEWWGRGCHIGLPSDAVWREVPGQGGCHGPVPGGGSQTLLPFEQKSRRARMDGATCPPPSR